MDVKRFIKDQLAARETRLRSPAFQAEMAREKTEWGDIAEKFGGKSMDFGVATVGGLFDMCMKSLRTLYDEKYGRKKYAKDSAKLFFDKDGVARSAGRVLAAGAHLTGKSAKIGLRYLIAK